MTQLPNPATLPIANAAADDAGRRGNGQFALGNTFAAGAAANRQAALLRDAFAETVTPENARDIAKMLVNKAIEGNIAAAKIVLHYCLGKPKATFVPHESDFPLPPPIPAELPPTPIPPRPLPTAKPAHDDMPPWMQDLAGGLPKKEVEAIFGKPKKPATAPPSHGVSR